jgi:hypothetical protein
VCFRSSARAPPSPARVLSFLRACTRPRTSCAAVTNAETLTPPPGEGVGRGGAQSPSGQSRRTRSSCRAWRVSQATTSSYEPAYLPVSKSGRVLCEKGRVQENGNRTPRRCRGREPTQLQAPRGR